MTSETTATSVPSGELTSLQSSDEIALSETDRSRVSMFLHAGQHRARARTRAQVLRKLGEGGSLAAVCRACDVCRTTVVHVRARFAAGGGDAVLRPKRQVRSRQALTGAQQAHLIAMACSKVPDGHAHWTVRMLAGKAVELGFVEPIAPETIRVLLKKPRASPGNIGRGVAPPR